MALPFSCVDKSERDCLKLVNKIDGQYFRGHRDDYLVLDFGKSSKRAEEHLEVVAAEKGMTTIALQVEAEKGWEDIAPLHPRENWSTQLIDLSPIEAAGREWFNLRLLWKSNHKLDYISLAQTQSSDIKIQKCPLKSAIHSKEGLVTNYLVSIDKEYTELAPGEQIDLTFSRVEPTDGYQRDFILVTTGYYVKGKYYESSPGDITDHLIPKSFSLSQNYPNPFNPVTDIKYAIPEDCWVRLEVYSILGEKVATLVNGSQEAGYKIVRWDAGSFPSGIYFYRIQAGKFNQSKKMVLLK